LGTGGSLREFSPDHAVSDGTFGNVICRLDTIDFREGPETIKMLFILFAEFVSRVSTQKLFANAFGLCMFYFPRLMLSGIDL
jgi:hypothetical protein